MNIPELTAPQTLALKRMFSSVQGAGWSHPSAMGQVGSGLDPRVAKTLCEHGLVENRIRTLRTGREVYSHSALTWKGAHVAWELCGCPALGTSAKWTKSDPALQHCDLVTFS